MSRSVSSAYDDFAAGNATVVPGYGDTSRLIRLLTVIGAPAPAEETMERTLAVLADALPAEVVCVASVIDDRLVVTAAHGLGADDPALVQGWPMGPAARQAIETATAVARARLDQRDCPPVEGAGPATACAWIPLASGSDPTGDLLMALRWTGGPFAAADVRVLESVGYRLWSAVETLERTATLERLAAAGPGLARHVDLDALLAEAVVLFRELTVTDSAFVVTLSDGVFELAAYTGTDTSIPRRWPRTVTTMPNWKQLSAGEAYVGQRERIPERPHETAGSPTVLCVPVMRDGVVLALLGATGHRARSFGKTGIDIATIMANYLSAAMANATLYLTLTEREQELRRQASHDPLTGLANRVYLGRRIAEALAASPDGVGLLFCDLDGFKAVNDRLGHETGDELLQQVAIRLRSAVDPDDLLSRFGGDEFVLLLPGVHHLGDLTAAGRRVQRCLSGPIVLRGERFAVSASIGAVLGRNGSSASMMLRHADAAMYVAKSQGPGRIEVFDDAASHRSIDRLDLRAELDHALERGELSVVFQPIVNLKTSAIRSFEALARWTHPVRGQVPPDVFIPMAEETGAIVPIGAWVLSQACTRLMEWQHRFPEDDLTVCVNVSMVQLERSHQDLLSVIAGTGADPHDIWLEVTERMDTSGDIGDQVAALRSAGVHFSLDDFGMSYSSLTYLQRFPVEGIKIDRTFVAPMTADETQRGIVRAILALGESLSVKVVAEGIETQGQVDGLLDLGCRYGQGYLLGRPMTAEACITALRGR